MASKHPYIHPHPPPPLFTIYSNVQNTKLAPGENKKPVLVSECKANCQFPRGIKVGFGSLVQATSEISLISLT